MTKTRTIALRCWVCSERFLSEQAGSYALRGRDSDLCPRPLGTNPLPLLLHTCTSCGFTGDAQSFHPAEADEQVREWVMAGGLALAARALPETCSGRYELAALCQARRRRPSPLKLAELYLAGAWSARLEGAHERAAALQAEAAPRLEGALLADEVTKAERAIMTYLAGELRRRIGEFEAALQLFDQAAIEFAEHGGPRWLLRALGQQARMARRRCSDGAPLAR